ncbi:MFS transporter [Pseudactinotalea sp. Z1732]|uniref:MFS transporter n=1 Tax=Pseudactinotalea sp. Z1732 TaxID=3413026 RepID=UPI003C7EB741
MARTTRQTGSADDPSAPQPPAPAATGGGLAARMLVLATVGFLINFWSWALLGPLGNTYGDELGLTGFQVAVAVAVPVVVGSLGRIPVGALSDRLGARVMFPLVSLLAILPTLYVGLGARSFTTLVIGGFFLGIGGTSFAIGIPLVNSWYPPSRRGLALGIFGMGTAGTAVAAFTTVALREAFGPEAPFVLVSAVLLIYAVLAWLLLRDAPGRVPASGSMLARTWNTLKLPVTLQLSLIYALGFGGFVAFSVYLPTYLVNDYGLETGDAALRTAGFIVLAVVARPTGGWLSDKFHPVTVLTWCFGIATAMAALAAMRLELLPVGTVAFLGLAATLGGAAGACFALVSRMTPTGQVGSVTGVVGAAGGLGGFFPPLVMGAVHGLTGAYTMGFVLLAMSALAMTAFVWWPVGKAARGAS